MQAQQLSNATLRIHEASDQAETNYRPRALALLGELLQFDSAVWASGTHTPHRLNSVYLFNQPKALIALYEREFLFKQDFVRCAAVSQPGKAARLSELKPRAEFEAMLTYKVLCRPLGIEQAMALARINQLTGLYEYIALWRKSPTVPFSERDALILELLSAHLFAGEQRWLARNLKSETPSDRIRVYAMFDKFGVLRVADTQVADHFIASWPGWRGPVVPAPLLHAARASKQAQAAKTFTTLDKRCYEVQPYRCPLVGEAFKLNIIHDANLAALSPREAAVAQLYAKGLSHKEIARNLGSAPATVRNQCMAVLRKLGINNKAELANRVGPQ